MDKARLDLEMQLIRSHYPEVELHSFPYWIRIPNWRIPETIWDRDTVSLCLQIPENLPGQAPYGFYVAPADLRTKDGSNPDSAQLASDTPFGGTWLKFSWAAQDWRPAADLKKGSNLLNFLNSILNSWGKMTG